MPYHLVPPLPRLAIVRTALVTQALVIGFSMMTPPLDNAHEDMACMNCEIVDSHEDALAGSLTFARENREPSRTILHLLSSYCDLFAVIDVEEMLSHVFVLTLRWTLIRTSNQTLGARRDTF
ncbi:hypothetical protein OE88DRAFT_1134156 [Heliocybe sulcata]|uniref:Uncharacterized protein n=1 Tax=Heliocybe sulcata TaxID=5364 RepID=A0A5C3N9M1_9AGAM|nr:hypothetical protein OE88DRAFT_1134156 [Heliocybe sulcata]